MDESCSIQAPSSSCIKKNETTEVVSQKSNFEGSPQYSSPPFIYLINNICQKKYINQLHHKIPYPDIKCLASQQDQSGPIGRYNLT